MNVYILLLIDTSLRQNDISFNGDLLNLKGKKY